MKTDCFDIDCGERCIAMNWEHSPMRIDRASLGHSAVFGVEGVA